MKPYIQFENTAIVNFNLNLLTVAKQVESDLKRYNIKNENLSNKFILYRLVYDIIEQIKYCKGKGIKLLLFLNSSKLVEAFPNKHIVIVKYIKKITSLLNICFLSSFDSYGDFCRYLTGRDGVSVEKKNTVKSLCNKHLKNPNFKKFTDFLNKNNIQKIDNITKNNTFKLGLFLT